MALKIASRQSDLARIQALTVGAELQKKDSSLEGKYHFREALGDQNLDDPLWKMPEQGVFTQDFYEDLVSGQHDMIVHSWKDLPVEERAHTEIVATLPREDMRDLLVIKKEVWQEVQKTGVIKIYSSSPRRIYNLSSLLPKILPTSIKDISFESVRGNVPTRFKKMFADPTVAGMIVAKAGIDRLLGFKNAEFEEMQEKLRGDLQKLNWMVLPLSENPCAAAQGALAIEIRSDRDDLREQLKKIHCEATFQAVIKERKILSSYGGGCHQKIGVSVLNRSYGELTFLKGLTDEGQVLDSQSLAPYSENESVWPQAGKEEVFLPSDEEFSFFSREEVSFNQEQLKRQNLWVARANALPRDYLPSQEQLVWCSGLKTWQKLASRGVWVNGCAESLGEKEKEQISEFENQKKWVKLTHASGVGDDSLSTYKLNVSEDKVPVLKDKRFFYWSSFSQFKAITNKNPSVLEGYHGCGPGNTYDLISREIKDKKRINIFLNYEAWKKEVIR